jgi:hypothetical protein
MAIKTEEEIKKEINNMELDLVIMKEDTTLLENNRKMAIFTQEQVIKALKWTINIE